MKQMNQKAELLPIAKVLGREFLVDIDRREFRDFNDPEKVIGMHSPLGRQFVKEMQGTEWNCMGISTGIDRGIEV